MQRKGVAATTVDDIARGAGCSRATVYRVFPGGKHEVLRELAGSELASLLSVLAGPLAAARSVEAVLVEGIWQTGTWLRNHPLVRRLVDQEPELVLPWLSFDRQGAVLASASAWAAPYLQRWLDRDRAVQTAEWATRIVLSYGIGNVASGDLTDRAWVSRIVRTYVLPAVVPA